ncbi:MAG: hypothetical protein ACXADL_12885 [Candidatus Thorarchaeota archaeon]|jgi:hypothetical protein
MMRCDICNRRRFIKSIDAGTVILLDYHESGHNVSKEKGYRIIREWICEHCNREIGNKSMKEEMDEQAQT